MEKESSPPTETITPQHQEMGEVVRMQAERLQTIASALPEDYRHRIERVVEGVDDARTRSSDQAAEIGVFEMSSARGRAMNEVIGFSANESGSKTALEVKIHSRLMDIPTRGAIDKVAERRGIKTKPYAVSDLMYDEQTGRLNSKSEAYQRLTDGRRDEATYRLVVQKSEFFLIDYKKHVVKKAVEGILSQPGAEVSTIDSPADHTEEFRTVGAETFDSLLEEKLARLETVTSRKVARGIGKVMLRNFGVNRPKDDDSFSSKESREAALYHAVTDIEQLINRGPNLHHAVSDKANELGLKESAKNHLQDRFNQAIDYATAQCNPEKLDGLLDQFFARHIVPELESKGYVFAQKTKQQHARQSGPEPGSTIKTQYDRSAVEDVETDIRNMQNQGLSESDIRKRLLRKYHPDVSKDPQANEKIRYYNERER